jgi:hypothetical protein
MAISLIAEPVDLAWLQPLDRQVLPPVVVLKNAD